MLVHRDEQLAQLRRAFRACEEQGYGHVALVTGAVGSGKTQVLEEFGEWAAAAGARVLAAGGSRAEHGLQFEVLGQLLYHARLGKEDASRLGDLLREAALSLPDARPVAESDQLAADGPGWAPLLRGVFGTLLELAEQAPLVISVDDLHHMDAASLHCLLYVIRRLRHARIMVLLSEAPVPRPAHPLFHAELRSQPRFARIDLPPLSTDSVARLLGEDRASGDVRDDARQLVLMAGGNPLLTQALVEERSDRALRPSAPHARGGDGFDQAVLRCLYRHEPGVRRTARALAVLDDAAPAELLGQVLDVLPDSTATVVRILHGSGLVEGGRLRHPRIVSSILSDMPVEERRRLHRRAAEVLHEQGAEPCAVAGHLVASGWTRAPWVVPVLKDAAAHALSSGRPDVAAACLRLVVRAEPDEERRIPVVRMLVEARWQVNPAAVSAPLGELVEAARSAGWSTATGLDIVPYLLWQGRAEEAVAAVSGFTPGERGEGAGRLQVSQLLVALSHPDFLADVRRTPSSWSRAATVPHAVGPALQAVSVLGNALIPTGGVDTVAAAEQVLQRHHGSSGALSLLPAPLAALLVAGRADRAAAWCDALMDHPATAHAPTWRAVLRAIHAEATLRLGDPAGAEHLARAALDDLPVAAWGVAAGGPLGTLIGCATEAGRLREADHWLAQPVPPGLFRTPAGVHYLAARGRHHLAMGRHQAATADLSRCGELMRGWGIDAAGLVPWRLDLARVQVALGNRTQAVQLLQEQLQAPHGVDDRTRGRALRLLASTAAPDQRRKLLSKAVGLLQGCGDLQELARALTDTGQALQQAGDSAQARLFVRRADQLSHDLATVPVVPSALDRAGAGAAAPADEGEAREQDDVLSEAERRVAVLAARGHTNRQISNELFITVSTVEQHLTRVYRKLDVKRRTDLPKPLLAAEPVAEGERGKAS
ncbi:LuxR family transcriptional regulator [uncultured Streptomyces sp.]|uniref:helix-turn-helix transcriptional regulator n=1 Tax=uncultured Streptomyces sp. TaxID=174707 RepID=UPI00262CC9EF|nr:LuxR family transcriptional regulator [uncultured Streptomyces sp.]